MGSSTSRQIAEQSLFGRTRSILLAMIYGHADQSFYLRQLVRAVGGGHGALQRELKRLTEMGLIVRRPQGNQVLYQANSQSPIFSEVKSLIAKTVGIHDVIRSALAPLGSEIQIAFVYGSVSRGETNITASQRRIVELRMAPANAKPLPMALAAIESADLITIGSCRIWASP